MIEITTLAGTLHREAFMDVQGRVEAWLRRWNLSHQGGISFLLGTNFPEGTLKAVPFLIGRVR